MPAISELLPPRARAIIYVLSAMLAAAWLVIVENADLHWGWVAAYSAWTVGVNLLAAVNTSARINFVEQAQIQRDLAIAAQVNRIAEVDG
jgi:hypothetical protein